jgi:hypothetical protein
MKKKVELPFLYLLALPNRQCVYVSQNADRNKNTLGVACMQGSSETFLLIDIVKDQPLINGKGREAIDFLV